jgi:penicillin-binding protein 2
MDIMELNFPNSPFNRIIGNMERKFVVQGIFIVVAAIFIIRLFLLQVASSDYKELAQRNATRRMIDYAPRGVIYARDGKPLVTNTTVFDLMIVLKETKIQDTTEFCRKLHMTKEELNKVIKEIRKDKAWSRPTALIKQLSFNDLGRIEDVLVDYKGLYTQTRIIRNYEQHIMASALGYIGEISKKQLEGQKENYYSKGDYLGISGLESFYEEELRGKRGVKYMMVDVKGAEKGSLLNGKYDTIPVPGQDLYTSIDGDLQAYAEKLIAYKKGGIVAIEPSSGEILAFVSAPTYDPNMLAGRKFAKNAFALQKDTLKPLFNRPLMAKYPPGSIFKIAQALIGLQLGVINEHTLFPCNKDMVNCHNHASPLDLRASIQHSCNPYYYQVFKRIINQDKFPDKFKDTEAGYDEWYHLIRNFGFGQKLGVDIPNEKAGSIPSNAFYDKIYGHRRWKFSTIYSLGIGQGEIGMVPLQMANFAACLANKGYYIAPHFVKGIGEDHKLSEKYKEKHYTGIDSKYFEIIADGMEKVVSSGTAAASKIKEISICGKTGTVQNPHGEDHSVFIAYAPKENPKIAIAVFVENAGWGGAWAAPIASLMIEKYLTDTITRGPLEKKILEKRFYEPKPVKRSIEVYAKDHDKSKDVNKQN